MVLRALLFSIIVYAMLFAIALMIAGIIRLLFAVVHKSEKKAQPEIKVEAKVTPQ